MKDNDKMLEKFFSQIRFDDIPDPEHRDKLEQDLLATLSKQTRQKESPIKIWRTIMKTRIAKLAAAVVIIIVVVLLISFFDKSVTPAYAIEQTIEAIRAISTVHLVCTDWEDKTFEVWLKLDPETGKETHLYAIVPSLGTTIISEPNGSYVYSEENKSVQVYDNKIAKSDLNFAHIFEDMAEQMGQLENGESVEIYRFTEPESDEDFIVISIDTKKQETEILIDPETKLPVRISRTRAKNMGDILKSADEFNYNVPIPSELVNFEIPSDVRLVDSSEQLSLLDDPNFGIPVRELSPEEAFIKLAEEYWNAVINGDWDSVRNLYPSLGMLSDDAIKAKHGGKNPPIALLEIEQPCGRRGLGLGQVTPCIVKFADSKILRIELITVFREIDDYSFCVIFGTWGKARQID